MPTPCDLFLVFGISYLLSCASINLPILHDFIDLDYRANEDDNRKHVYLPP